MQAQGLIERSRTAGDDRVVVNVLTPKAKAMKKDAVRVPIDLICRSGIEMRDLEHLRAKLGDLIVLLQKMQGPTPPAGADE
jgi:DNA-binding MarR family transcriptional regulator